LGPDGASRSASITLRAAIASGGERDFTLVGDNP
jgi:hypothetical protein